MSLPERRGGTMVRRWDPFRELDDFRERMSRMLDQTFGGKISRNFQITHLFGPGKAVLYGDDRALHP